MAEMTLQLTADTAELERLHAALEAFAARAGLADETLFHLNLALDELITNTINYGFAGCDSPRIRLHISAASGRVSVELRDNGTPFDPFTEAPQPDLEASLAERRIGGLGVHLVKQLMDSVAYRRENGDNCVEMSLRQRR